MNLSVAEEGKEYIIQRGETGNEELYVFLFSQGCYSDEPVIVISRRRSDCTMAVCFLDPENLIDTEELALIVLYARINLLITERGEQNDQISQSGKMD